MKIIDKFKRFKWNIENIVNDLRKIQNSICDCNSQTADRLEKIIWDCDKDINKD